MAELGFWNLCFHDNHAPFYNLPLQAAFYRFFLEEMGSRGEGEGRGKRGEEAGDKIRRIRRGGKLVLGGKSLYIRDQLTLQPRDINIITLLNLWKTLESFCCDFFSLHPPFLFFPTLKLPAPPWLFSICFTCMNVPHGISTSQPSEVCSPSF